MEDTEILKLYLRRDESAIAETAAKYGNYCFAIADRILHSHEDAQECVNDAYLNAWNSIPPHQPVFLGGYLGKLTRNLSLNRWRERHSQKRGGGEIPLVLDELLCTIPASQTPETEVDQRLLVQAINTFVRSLPEAQRRVFLKRYFCLASIADIAHATGCSESKIKSMLLRQRNKLREHLEKEGIFV